jgi:hypothetical protein
VILFVIAAFLLISMGGAIFAAPITLPLMFVAVRRRPSTPCRAAATVIGGLTAAEVVWAGTYLALTEAKPWIWLLPSLGTALAIYVFLALAPPNAQRSAPAVTA